MFTLDDLLSLLCDSVELDIFSTFLKVGDLKPKTLVLLHKLLEERLILKDFCHIFNFSVTTVLECQRSGD